MDPQTWIDHFLCFIWLLNWIFCVLDLGRPRGIDSNPNLLPKKDTLWIVESVQTLCVYICVFSYFFLWAHLNFRSSDYFWEVRTSFLSAGRIKNVSCRNKLFFYFEKWSWQTVTKDFAGRIFTTWINFLKNLYGSFDQWSLTDKRDINYRGVERGSHYFFFIFADHAGKSE